LLSIFESPHKKRENKKKLFGRKQKIITVRKGC